MTLRIEVFHKDRGPHGEWSHFYGPGVFHEVRRDGTLFVGGWSVGDGPERRTGNMTFAPGVWTRVMRTVADPSPPPAAPPPA